MDEDDPEKMRVDACLFYKEDLSADTEVSNDETTKSPSKWDVHRLHIEFKSKKDSSKLKDSDPKDAEDFNIDDKNTWGEIISYAALTFKHQHRCFLFTIIVCGPEARLLRWGRSGALLTEKFNYKRDSTILCNFFRKFARLSKVDQGIDTSVLVATDGEREMMKTVASDGHKLPFCDYVRQYFAQSLNPNTQWWKIPMKTSTGSEKYFLVGMPHFSHSEVAGHSTRGYVAFNPDYEKDGDKCPKFVQLMDSWLADCEEGIQEESTTEKLNAKDVENVPHLLFHGDVDDQTTHALTYWQGTKVILREVERPLESFTNGCELTAVMVDAIKGK